MNEEENAARYEPEVIGYGVTVHPCEKFWAAAGGLTGGEGGPGSPGKDISLGGEGGPAHGLHRLTFYDIMKILREEIIGDGQGYPCDGERSGAAERILAEIDRRYPVNNPKI